MKLLAVMAVLIFGGLAWADPPATAPSPQADKLKANVKTFMLSLQYHGDQEKPFYGLLLSVSQVPKQEKAPLSEATQITEDEARAIIDHLAAEGFLDKAMDGNRNAGPVAPTGPYYALTVRAENNGDPIVYEEWLG